MRLFVSLNPDKLDRLTALARTERRRPQDQAAVLLERALEALELPTHTVSPVKEGGHGTVLAEERHEQPTHV